MKNIVEIVRIEKRVNVKGALFQVAGRNLRTTP